MAKAGAGKKLLQAEAGGFLDQPTASIDPLEEMQIYNKLNGLAEGRTVILVTHRLGAIKHADKIIVLENGAVVEEGNFEQLIERKGYFYFLWNEQTKWYQNGRSAQSRGNRQDR